GEYYTFFWFVLSLRASLTDRNNSNGSFECHGMVNRQRFIVGAFHDADDAVLWNLTNPFSHCVEWLEYCSGLKELYGRREAIDIDSIGAGHYLNGSLERLQFKRSTAIAGAFIIASAIRMDANGGSGLLPDNRSTGVAAFRVSSVKIS